MGWFNRQRERHWKRREGEERDGKRWAGPRTPEQGGRDRAPTHPELDRLVHAARGHQARGEGGEREGGASLCVHLGFPQGGRGSPARNAIEERIRYWRQLASPPTLPSSFPNHNKNKTAREEGNLAEKLAPWVHRLAPYLTSQATRLPSSVVHRRVEGAWGHQPTHSGSACSPGEEE